MYKNIKATTTKNKLEVNLFALGTYRKQGLSAQLTPGLQTLPSPMKPAGQRPHLGPEAVSWQSTPVGSKMKRIKMKFELGSVVSWVCFAMNMSHGSLTRITRIRSAAIGLEAYMIVSAGLLAARTVLQKHAQVGNLLTLVGDIFAQQLNQCQKIAQ